jgi:photosystem II stability/assembly factor-like uncharacterized protein
MKQRLLYWMAAATFVSAAPAGAAPARAAQAKPAAATGALAFDKALFAGLEWRSIGPYRGGRVTAVAGVRGEPRTYYFGGTGGGVFKTEDGGISWQPIADGQLKTGSVGAIAVADSDPNVVYVGMGSACIRGNISHGDGVYKSTDAGKTWTHVGLERTEQIGAVRVHPQDPDLVYVAALGHTFGANPERGVFRSKDGGKTWEKVLFVDDKTGAVDLAMDPGNPRVLFAAFWQAQRTPWSLESGGPGSSLWKSTDGGDHWTKLAAEGLPKKGVWGRIGVTVSPADSSRVYAIIEAEDGGVFRSDDGGKAWRRTNDERRLRQRAWYYTHIFADPKNADALYVLNTGFYRSQDGGKSFNPIRVPHGDNHDLWVAPDDPLRMIESNDGGANVSFDGGKSWSSEDNQPTAELYHVVADHQFPYMVYGAQQDNSTVGIASRTDGFGIAGSDWYPVGGCESGYVAVDPRDRNIVYAGCYDGVITRYDHRTGQERDVNVYPDNPMGWGAEGMKYRFQWTFPIVISPHDPDTLYAAGNVLFKSTNGGQSWQPISPDLTRNDPTKLRSSGGPITQDNTSIEYYCTIFAFAESPVQKGVLWAGSDDGLVHVSKDGGASWQNVTPKDLPEWSMVSQVDPSPFDAGTMFLAVNRYKLDDKRPFVYMTTDYGQTWKKLVSGIPDDAFVRVVRQDTVNPKLLFAGTETGVYVSFDEGERWQPLQLNLPVVPITDLIVKDDDVVLATQGRAFWVLDHIEPLRELTKTAAEADAFLFKPGPTYRFGGRDGRGPVGKNPPYGAAIDYLLKQAPKEEQEISLEILDPAGKLVRRFTSKPEHGEGEGQGGPEEEFFGRRSGARRLPAKAGLNRFVWDLQYPEASRFKGMILWGGRLQGPLALPGRYVAKLTVGAETLSEPFEVREDPRLEVSQADLQKQFDLLLKIRDKLTETHDGIKRLREAREQIQGVAERSKGNKLIADSAKALTDRLTKVEEALYQTKNRSNQDPLNFPIRLDNKLAALAGTVASADSAPTDQSYVVYDDLVKRIDAELQTLKGLLSTDVAAFNALVKEQNVPAVVLK